jgi:hypothetical protein
MPQTYTFPLPPGSKPEALLARAKEQGKGKGIVLVGDVTKGSFKGTADGSYVMSDGSITITVDKKPGFVPWAIVEGALRDLFAKA